jgi:hypothetical protein
MITTLYTQNQNESPLSFAQRIDAALFLLGPIGISQILMQHRDGSNGSGLLYLTIIYATGAGISLRSVAFLGTALSTATTQANAFLAANPTYVPQRIFDIGSQNRRSLARDVVMLLYVDSSLPSCQSFNGLIPVQSLTDIAAGAAGQAWQLTADGNKGPYPVINKQQGNWPAGGTGWAFADPLTCVLNGYPSCCAGVPATTSSTSSTTSTTTTSTSSTSTTTTTSSSTTTTPPPGACPQCVTPEIIPGSVTVDFGSTFLVSNGGIPACNAPSWSPGTLVLSITGTGTSCLFQFGTQGDNQKYAFLIWDGSTWVVAVFTAGVPQPDTTIYAVWTGPSTPCDPRGEYTSPTTPSACDGGSTPAATVTVS